MEAAYERDYGWIDDVLTADYAGDDTAVRALLGGVLAAYDGISVDDFEARAEAFLRHERHPTLAAST